MPSFFLFYKIYITCKIMRTWIMCLEFIFFETILISYSFTIPILLGATHCNWKWMVSPKTLLNDTCAAYENSTSSSIWTSYITRLCPLFPKNIFHKWWSTSFAIPFILCWSREKFRTHINVTTLLLWFCLSVFLMCLVFCKSKQTINAA